MKNYRLVRSVKNPGTFIRVSAEIKKADAIYLDPFSYKAKGQTSRLIEAGYKLKRRFNKEWIDTDLGGSVYRGSMKLTLKK